MVSNEKAVIHEIPAAVISILETTMKESAAVQKVLITTT